MWGLNYGINIIIIFFQMRAPLIVNKYKIHKSIKVNVIAGQHVKKLDIGNQSDSPWFQLGPVKKLEEFSDYVDLSWVGFTYNFIFF